MTECYIFDAVRTPRGRGKARNGSLAEMSPLGLARTVLTALAGRSSLDTREVDDVVLGCVEPVGEQGANIGRLAAIYSGYHEEVPGMQVNRFCASGLEAINIATAQIKSGTADLMVAGGVESMSRVPMGSAGGSWATDPDLSFKSFFVPQGISADLIATRQGYSRADVDGYAVTSQQRAAAAWEKGHFKKSVIPVVDEIGMTLLDRDEHMRPDATVESLGALKPSFAAMGASAGFDDIAIQRYPDVESINHVHHAGNASGIVDGASAVLLGTKEAGERLGLKARGKVVMSSSIGAEPCIMLTAPADSALKALKRAKMEVKDIDLYEVNEAFAVVPMLFMDRLSVGHDRVNVNGGAIAMGHPLGATGAMLLGTALDELERSDKQTALVTLCVGAGMGTATIIERV